MDLECFALRLAPDQTSLVELIENHVLELEGTQSKIKTELRALNVYSAYLIVVHYSDPETESLFSSRFILKASHQDPARKRY
jgi:hypothetical protein